MNPKNIKFRLPNYSIGYLIEIFIESPFQVSKRVESFFIQNKNKNELIYRISQQNAYISDFRSLFKLYHNSVQIGFYVPKNLNNSHIAQDYSYLLVDTSTLNQKLLF
jgi:hypothetical protein